MNFTLCISYFNKPDISNNNNIAKGGKKSTPPQAQWKERQEANHTPLRQNKCLERAAQAPAKCKETVQRLAVPSRQAGIPPEGEKKHGKANQRQA